MHFFWLLLIFAALIFPFPFSRMWRFSVLLRDALNKSNRQVYQVRVKNLYQVADTRE